MNGTRYFKKIAIIIFMISIIFVFTACGVPNIEKLKTNRDAEGLIKALEYEGSEEGVVRPAAQQALIDIGYDAVEPLIEALDHKNENTRGTAARLLGIIGDTRAVEPLIAALESEDMYLSAAYALGLIGDTSATGPLMEKLKYYRETGNEYTYEALVDVLTMINIQYILSVCDGEVVSTQTYQQNEPGLHPVIIADPDLSIPFSDNWNNLIPAEWRSLGSPDKIELVLCYQIEEIVVEKCNYGDGGTITRIRHDWNVELREAKTGQIITTGVIEGDPPNKCPGFRAEGSPDSETIGEVSQETLTDWLKEFIE